MVCNTTQTDLLIIHGKDVQLKQKVLSGFSFKWWLIVNNLLLTVVYSAKFWQEKTLANLAEQMSFVNILPSQIPN